MNENNISNENLYKLLFDYQKLESYELSYFDILGISKRELSYSKFLKFFFDTTEKHNLKDLFIQSLLKSINISVKNDIKTESVILEYNTYKNGRIDIVVETNNLVVVIENKIEANLYNDLNDYKNTIKKDFNKEKYVYIILSINKVDGDKQGFKNILYSEFIKELKLNLHNYISKANSNYLLLFKEFIKHIENYNKRDDFSKAKFYFENRKIIDNLEYIDKTKYDKENFIKILKTRDDYYNYLAKQITQVAYNDLLKLGEIKKFIDSSKTEIRRNKNIRNSKIGLRNGDLEKYGIFFLWIRMCDNGKSLRISTDIEETNFYKNDKGNVRLKELVKDLKKEGFESGSFNAIYIKKEITSFSKENEISELILEIVKNYWVKYVDKIEELIEKIKKINK